MGEVAGRYLYAVDRRDVMGDRTKLIRQFAASVGTGPEIVELYSRSNAWLDGIADVRREVREVGCRYDAGRHVVVIVTHEALKSSDLSTYDGWTCIIDEVPSIWTQREMMTPASSLYLAATYNLIPISKSGWSEVQIKAGGVLLTDMHRDTLLGGLTDMHRQVRDRGVFANISNWDETVDGHPWSWLAIWNPELLGSFEHVYLLGNACEHTLTYKLIRENFADSVSIVPFDIPNQKVTVWHSRTLTIRYFAKSHRAGSTFWKDSPNGRECLRRIAWWVNAHSRHENHFWSCNTQTLGIFTTNSLTTRAIIGQKVSPKIAGENGLRHLTCGTFIYASKPSDAERSAFGLFGISGDDIVRSREHEDLVQMLWRSSLRIPEDCRPVEFRVYDLWQAEFLRTFIAQTAPHVTVTLEQIDLGLDEFRPRPRGKPKLALTGAETKARADRKREQARLRQQRHRNKIGQVASQPQSAVSRNGSIGEALLERP